MGTIYLVGGGPGHPGLLTVRAARLLRRAEVVIHDALIGPGILELVPPTAERIDVGKRCAGQHTTQERIHEILIEAARRARVVVRLKGGDPFVFGRGGEEALALRRAGVRFEVVPGITAALGIGAFAGIPLTHRGVSSAVSFVTGHECAAAGGEPVDWNRLATAGGTLVVYMATRKLAELADRLIRCGRSPLTPAAVVEWGTCARQRTVEAPLFELADRVERAGLGAPALVVVGDVVALRGQIEWFQRRPLHGLRILVPRSRGQRSRLASALSARGAEVVESPRVVIRAPREAAPLQGALQSIAAYGWVMFTSPTAVDRFWEAALAAGMDARAFASQRFACFGTATRTALLRRGIRADVATPTFVSSSVRSAFGRAADLAGRKVLFPRDGEGRSALAEEIAAAGARVHEVEAYHEEIDPEDAADVERQLRAGEISVIAFASTGTVRHFVERYGAEVGGAAVAVIGEQTAATARMLGLPVHLLPRDSTLRGLLREIHGYATDRIHSRHDAGAPAGGARLAPQC